MQITRRFLVPVLAAGLTLGLLGGCVDPAGGPSTGAAAQAEVNQSRALLDDLRRKDLIVEDRALMRYVDSVAARIEPQRPDGVPPLRTFVVKNPEVNAFTTGGGYVFINVGLMSVMENEAQFATVLAHEIAHVDRGHVARGMQTRQTAGMVGLAAMLGGALLGVPADLTQAAVGTGQQLAVSSFTREQETDADLTGFRYAAAAGYNAAEGAKSFEVLRRLYGEQGGVAKFFSSHPQSSERQAQLQRLARAEGADTGRIAEADYLRATAPLRRETLKWYERNDRPAEARQARANLARSR